MRGLRAPTAGWALITPSVAYANTGRASDSRKQGNVTGLGKAFTRLIACRMLLGAFDTPSGAWQRASSGGPSAPGTGMALEPDGEGAASTPLGVAPSLELIGVDPM